MIQFKKNYKFFAKLAISGCFVAWLLLRMDWEQVLVYFKQFDIWWTGGFLFFYIIGLFLSAYKWKLLAEFKGIKEKYLEFFKIYLTGTFINNFFPSIVGGDTYRSYTLGRLSDKKYLESTSTVLIDRLVGFFGVMFLILVFALLDFKSLTENPILIVINILVIAAFGFDFFLVLLRALPVWKYLNKYAPQFLIKLLLEMDSFRKNYNVLGVSFFWGTVYNFVGVGLASWMLFQDLHININFVNFMEAVSVISIISSIPISIGNIGIKEWGYVTMFGIFGADGEAVISIAIMGRLLQMFVSFFAIPFYLQEKNKNRERLQE